MNNMLVSDYDGAFYISDEDILNNILKVNLFMNNNIFMLATGRTYKSIFAEITKYQIPFNYLSCCGSNVLFDENLKVKYFMPLYSNLTYFLNKYSLSIADFTLYDVYGEKESKNPIECDIVFENLQARKLFLMDILNNNEFTYYTNPQNKLNIHLYNNSNKINAIRYLEICNIVSNNNIFTIGDGKNDYEMIKNYNGCRMQNSNICLNGISLKTYSSVSNFITDIEQGIARIRSK